MPIAITVQVIGGGCTIISDKVAIIVSVITDLRVAREVVAVIVVTIIPLIHVAGGTKTCADSRTAADAVTVSIGPKGSGEILIDRVVTIVV
tara:strand:- start:1152 stop:1424 length:273 start_codon:yes stop_codon:yes gene_type:complete